MTDASATGSRGSTSRRSDSDLRLVEPRLPVDRVREATIALALLFAAELMFIGALIGCNMILGGSGEPPAGRSLAASLAFALTLCAAAAWAYPFAARVAATFVSVALAVAGGWLAWNAMAMLSDLWPLAGIGMVIHNILAVVFLTRLDGVPQSSLVSPAVAAEPAPRVPRPPQKRGAGSAATAEAPFGRQGKARRARTIAFACVWSFAVNLLLLLGWAEVLD